MYKILTFDLEIKKCIPDKNRDKDPNYEYCEGWKDYENMGISVAAAMSNAWREPILYNESSIHNLVTEFQTADLICGYNIFGFDVALLKATLVRLGHPEKTGMSGKCYDIFMDIRASMPSEIKWPKLDEIAVATLGHGKNGDGANAPRLYQDNQLKKLDTYVMNDVTIEHDLIMYALDTGKIIHPEFGDIKLTKIEKHYNRYQQYLKEEKKNESVSTSTSEENRS